MKMTEITHKDEQELKQLVEQKRAELAQLAIDQRTQKTTNVKQVHAIKKLIARALTIIREREISRLEQANG